MVVIIPSSLLLPPLSNCTLPLCLSKKNAALKAMRCYLTSSYIAMNFIKKWPNIDPAVACRVLTIRRKKIVDG